MSEGRETSSTTPAETFAPRLVQFLAVARHENVSRAAEQLWLGQSALSRAITRLEADLGLALFSHQSRRLKLTPAGRTLATLLEPLVRHIDQAVEEAGGSVDPQHGHVRLGFLRSMGDEVVPTMISAFAAREPDIEFTVLKEGSNADLLGALRDGEIDLALLAPEPKEPDIAGELLETQRLHLEVPANHRLAAVGTARFQDLAAETFVALTSGYGLRQILDGVCRAAGFRPNIAFQGDDIRTVRALVASGAGIALLPPAAQPSAGTVAVPVTEPVATRDVCLVRSTTNRLSAPAETFRAFMVAQRGQLFPCTDT
ncbi:LysR substrate-binding domain-containing protein [Streptomyces griseiscabiei]|uniref:LysR substrate-binding domain-containing protein n=1 Tax=Streptomyces griseiscabiei TaxID=2993540 RepID=A0ABU4LKE9_9ACTN|nr:LysR substrate-binding domain-containing protein [Streptomyces griseiscabiei]MBZ3900367.1 LysR family transcriptional regulator [Streptomyces griseiscabiei]MDX2916301.1 LysR substrate-binding domain-containing protein [Streptomyces griseiscabiei]